MGCFRSKNEWEPLRVLSSFSHKYRGFRFEFSLQPILECMVELQYFTNLPSRDHGGGAGGGGLSLSFKL